MSSALRLTYCKHFANICCLFIDCTVQFLNELVSELRFNVPPTIRSYGDGTWDRKSPGLVVQCVTHHTITAPIYYVPLPKVRGHIGFSADPRCPGLKFVSPYFMNHLEFFQTCIDTTLGQAIMLIRLW